MNSSSEKPIRARWRWVAVLTVVLPAAAGFFIVMAYLGTARRAEQLIAWIDLAQQQGLGVGIHSRDPYPFLRPYPLLRKLMARPIVSVWANSDELDEALKALPPCPVEVRAYHRRTDGTSPTATTVKLQVPNAGR